MYERSAIVLENYFSKIFGLNKLKNLKTNYEEYAQMIEEIKEYQRVMQEEEKIMKKFEEAAAEIEEIQKKQSQLHEENINIENQRDQIFNDLSENPSILYQKLEKIENKVESNNEELKNIREKYIKALVIFTERQKERNKYARMHRTTETEYLNNVKIAIKDFDEIDNQKIQEIKKFVQDNKNSYIQEIIEIMLKNGKNERVQFDQTAITNAVNARMEIAQEEANLYLSIYERMKKLLVELSNGNIKLAKSEKLLRDASVKFAFLNAEKEYIVSFLDNERITAMNGKIIHQESMKEACKNFVADINQINNLYELVVRETVGKATKKAYKELYNKTYLKEIQEKERDFEEEVTNIKINIGTVINSNYWRIEGIKNIYNTFQDEIGEKFGKDLSDYKIEDLSEKNQENAHVINKVVEEEEEENIEDYIKIDKKQEKNEPEEDANYTDDSDYDEEDYDGYDDEYEEENYDEDDYDEYDNDYDYGDEYDSEYDDYEDDEYDDQDDESEYEDDYYDDDEYDEFEEVQFDEEEEESLNKKKNSKISEPGNKKNKNGKKGEKGERGIFGKLFGK
mgnify:FL=1